MNAKRIAIFSDDDRGYDRWCTDHPRGYVLNTERRDGSRYRTLHHSTCRDVRVLKKNATTWTQNDYIKVCALERAELDDWAERFRGGRADRCGSCFG